MANKTVSSQPATPAPPAVTKPAPADPVEVAGRLRLSVTRLARILRHQDAGGLVPTLSAALATIDREGPLTLGALRNGSTWRRRASPRPSSSWRRWATSSAARTRPTEGSRGAVITPAGHRHVMQNRSRRTAWLATRLQDLSPDDIERLAAAADVLDRLIALPPGEHP